MKFTAIEGKSKNDDVRLKHFNWQASLIGIEVGSPTVRGFAEVGMGEQGIVCAGLRCKF